MAEGVFTQGRTDAGAGSNAMSGSGQLDNFRRATSGTAAGTVGIVISAKAGRFYHGIFTNGNAATRWIQIFDKATAPVNGDVPVWQQQVAASSDVEVILTDVNGIACTAGIGIAISSTSGTLTLAVANDLTFRSVIYTASNV